MRWVQRVLARQAHINILHVLRRIDAGQEIFHFLQARRARACRAARGRPAQPTRSDRPGPSEPGRRSC